MPLNLTNFIFKAAFIIILFLNSTVSHAQCCIYTLTMQDSYGDGWNGGQLEIFINNVSIGNFSGSSFSSLDTFQVCTGDTVQLLYSAGMYENENTYQLYDPAWNLIFGDGPAPQTGIVNSSYGTCSGIVVPGSNPCTAIPIDTGQCIVTDNTGILGSGIVAGCANYMGGDLWFTMTVPPSGNITLLTDSGGLTDTGLGVWTGTSCTSFYATGCDDDGGPGYFSSVTLTDLPPGDQIYIQVFGWGGGSGTFRVCAKDLGNINLDSSELPIFRISTLGQTIVPDNKINALLDIKYNGPGSITYLTDSANVYSGNIGIEIRGASSAGYPQRPYGFETRDTSGLNNNVSILGMPPEHDYVLLSNYNDRSLVRNSLAFKLFGDMGNYSVRTSLCELVLDSSYKGIYLFGEKIKRDANRINISKLTTVDTTGDELTGGYILQQNYWEPFNSFQSNYSPIDHPGFDIHFVYEYPKPDSILPVQKTYIATYVDSLEDALYGVNFADSIAGYRKYLDTKSFIDYFLINELARSNDGFKKSVFFNKNKYSNGGRLKAGPVWDFDWSWKTMYGCSIFGNNDGSGWAHHINDCPTDNYSCGWYIRLLQDSTFNNELKCAYEEYRQTIFDTTYIFAYIDSVKNLVQNAQARHFLRWPILGTSGPAPEINAIATTYNAEIDTLKAWIGLRLQWLDANIPGLCIPVNTGIGQTKAWNAIQYFPNPGDGNIHFEGFLNSTTPLQMTFYDITGKMMDRFPVQTGRQQFKYRLNRKGVYYFTITNIEGMQQYGKIIVM